MAPLRPASAFWECWAAWGAGAPLGVSVCLPAVGRWDGQLSLNNGEVLHTRCVSVIPSVDGQLCSSTSQLRLVGGWGWGVEKGLEEGRGRHEAN